MNVTVVYYNDLPEEEKSNFIYPPDVGSFLKVEIYGKPTVYHTDIMEPEDARFYRDLAWVKDALLEAYQAGKEAV